MSVFDFHRWLTTEPEETCTHADDRCCYPATCQCDCEGCVNAFLAAARGDNE